MANIPLQSISFPGLSDKYTTPVVDNTLTQTGAAADAKKTGDEIGAIKNDLSEFPNGNYPQMGAGYANQLVSGLKKADSTPYNFRAVPYDATLEEVEKIVGGTVAWNQFASTKTASVTPNGTNTYSYSSFATQDKIIAQHKYFICADVTYNGAKLPMRVYTQIGTSNFGSPVQDITAAGTKKCAWIAQFTSSSTSATLGISNVTTSDKLTSEDAWSFDNAMITDLTKELGTSIADYVYSLETATAGAGVAWLKKHFPKQFDAGYQAYDAGTLKSIEGLSGKKTVGFNQWDEEWELGQYNTNNGTKAGDSGQIRSKNYIPISPSTAYYVNTSSNTNAYFKPLFYDANKSYIGTTNSFRNGSFTSPSNAHYMTFYMNENYGTTYNHDICINLSDPTKNGTYEPYEAHSYALDSDVVLRGIPKLNSNNQLYYDGDEYLPDGTVNRRYGIVDLGTLTWTLGTFNNIIYFTVGSSQLPDLKKPASLTDDNNYRCGKYILVKTTGVTADFVDKSFFVYTSGILYFRDDSYNDASAFKTGVSGVYMVYEKAIPTTETADPYTTPQIIAPDGTEEYIYEDSAFELPVGHSSDYPIDVSGQLDDILDTPSANGTYVLKATVTDGAVTYSWVADA